MNDEKLYSITILTDAETGSTINELLPAVDIYPSSYFDCEDNIARLSLYYETAKEASDSLRLVKQSLTEWSELAGIDLSRVEVTEGDLLKEDWSEKWKEFFHAEKISDRLVIKPSWESYQASPEDIVIEIDPGMSFGTGNHGTTRGCLQLLDKLSLDIKGTFLDMGCGSGILSMAASKLGIKEIDAFDYDENSVLIAKENISLAGCENINAVVANLYEFKPAKKYDLVIANILASVLIDNVSIIVGSLKPGDCTRLVLSGILHEQFPKVQETFEYEGLVLVEHVKIDKWSTGLFKFLKL